VNYPDSPALIKSVESKTSSFSAAKPEETGVELTLDEALALAFKNDAGLKTAVLDVRSAKARSLQAGIYPNPEIAIELENFAGSGPLNGIEGSEATIQLSQPILLGGKRKKRVESAAVSGELAAWSVESKRLDLYASVHNAFNRLLIAQEDIALKNELVRLSQQFLETISERVQAGKISTAEASRAKVILAQNEIALERARRNLASARRSLAATWGSRSDTFTKIVGEYDPIFTLPPEDSLLLLLAQNPDVAKFQAVEKQRDMVVALEDAKAIPDPTVTAGLRRLNESGDLAFVVGLSLDLPFSNRNQGNREAARHELIRSVEEKKSVQIALSADLSEAYNLFQAIRGEAIMLKDSIIPQAESAYREINKGYLQGRFDFLDVLDAQRTLFESKDRYLHALREYHETVVRIERLIAQKIH